MKRPLMLIAVALILAAAIGGASSRAQQRPGNLDVYRRCPMEGSAKGKCSRELNRLKNRWRKQPGKEDINPGVTLTAMLAAGDDEFRWTVDQGAEIVGFVASVENTGGESVNCGGNSKGANDIHINLVLDPSVVKSRDYECQRAIVEITPRWQFINGWSFNQLRKEIEGKWVKFRGWMFFDRDHLNQAFNTRDSNSPRCGGTKGPFKCGGPVNKKIWRATAWEIHPVTGYSVLPGSPTNSGDDLEQKKPQ